MAEFYRCAVGPQLHRIFTRNSRQVGVGIVHFVKSGYSFNSCSSIWAWSDEYKVTTWLP